MANHNVQFNVLVWITNTNRTRCVDVVKWLKCSSLLVHFDIIWWCACCCVKPHEVVIDRPWMQIVYSGTCFICWSFHFPHPYLPPVLLLGTFVSPTSGHKFCVCIYDFMHDWCRYQQFHNTHMPPESSSLNSLYTVHLLDMLGGLLPEHIFKFDYTIAYQEIYWGT